VLLVSMYRGSAMAGGGLNNRRRVVFEEAAFTIGGTTDPKGMNDLMDWIAMLLQRIGDM
jgi:hypothetical protein